MPIANVHAASRVEHSFQPILSAPDGDITAQTIRTLSEEV